MLRRILTDEYLTKNFGNINNVIKKYRIKNIYDLSFKILSKNNIYSNILEEITCIENNKVNYLDNSNINYIKLNAFSELINVYTLSEVNVIELITEYNIYSINKLSENRLYLNRLNSIYGYETLGLEYYLKEYTINNKYYNLLGILDFGSLFDKELRDDSFKEKLIKSSNKELVKDIYSILVLFEYYSVFDKTKLEFDESDTNWYYILIKSIDLSRKHWELIYYFKKYRIKERIINLIESLTDKDDSLNIFSHKLNHKYNKKSEEKVEKEYKIVKKKVNVEDLNDKMDINYFKKNSSKVFLDIMKDIGLLNDQYIKINRENIVEYILSFIKIFLRKGRMFYLGFFLLLLSLIVYFIEISK